MDNSEALDRQLAAEVRNAMQAAGMSQRELAAKTGIPLVTLSRRLAGQGKGFTALELITCADAVGISFLELAIRAERSLPRSTAA